MRTKGFIALGMALAVGWALTSWLLWAANRELKRKLQHAEAQLAQVHGADEEEPAPGLPAEVEEAPYKDQRLAPPESEAARRTLQSAFAPPILDMVTHAQEDLDGDGTPEQIDLTVDPDDDCRFTLVVDGTAKIAGELDDTVDGFYIADVDQRDRFKEIAVHTSGPSDDDQHMLLWFDGHRLHRMGCLSKWPVYLGNGSVLVDADSRAMMTRRKFVLGPDRRLTEVSQPFLYMGRVGDVCKDECVLFQSRDSRQVMETLEPGRKVELLVCAGDPWAEDVWYLAVSDLGLVGWLNRAQFEKLATPPW